MPFQDSVLGIGMSGLSLGVNCGANSVLQNLTASFEISSLDKVQPYESWIDRIEFQYRLAFIKL